MVGRTKLALLVRGACLAIGLLLANVATAQAGDLSLFNGHTVSYIDLGNEANNVTVTDHATFVTVDDSAGLDVSGGCTQTSPFSATCHYAPGFHAAQVAVGNLSDHVRYVLVGPGAGFAITRTALGQGNDTLTGTPGPDLVLDGPGNDVYRLGAGNDHVFAAQVVSFPTFSGFAAGAGNDLIIGGPGNDILAGGLGNDRLFGGSGNDVLRGNRGIDHLFGGPGIDILDGRHVDVHTG